MASGWSPISTDMNAVDLQIGATIRRRRVELQCDEGSLAEAIGVLPSHLAAIEAGTVRPSAPELYDIAVALGATISDMFRDVPACGRSP